MFKQLIRQPAPTPGNFPAGSKVMQSKGMEWASEFSGYDGISPFP
jgi:hypothetical protein